MNTLTLYRGDADKIKEFEFKKTNKYCLLGQGIYLTNSLRVANTYRSKGAGKIYTHQLFYGQADNRNEALELGFSKFCELQWVSEHGYRPRYDTLPEKDKKKHVDKCRPLFRQFIEEKAIVADYTTAPVITAVRGRFTKPSATIAAQKELEKNHKRYLKVVWEEVPDAGYVTRFEFAEHKFNPAVFHVDKACNDEFFWELMYDEKLLIGNLAETKEEYIRLNKGMKVFDAVNIPVDPQARLTMKMRIAKRDSKDTWRKIGNIIRPYGFVGYEYNGGMRLGGGYNHRAFCIWDEEYVNDHKVERFK